MGNCSSEFKGHIKSYYSFQLQIRDCGFPVSSMPHNSNTIFWCFTGRRFNSAEEAVDMMESLAADHGQLLLMHTGMRRFTAQKASFLSCPLHQPKNLPFSLDTANLCAKWSTDYVMHLMSRYVVFSFLNASVISSLCNYMTPFTLTECVKRCKKGIRALSPSIKQKYVFDI